MLFLIQNTETNEYKCKDSAAEEWSSDLNLAEIFESRQEALDLIKNSKKWENAVVRVIWSL